MNKVEQELTYVPKLLSNSKNSSYYMTYIEGNITNPHKPKQTGILKSFIVDTGAAITILGSSCGDLFKDGDTPIIDYINIQYGSGTTTLPVYEIKLKIKGIEFVLPAAFDKNMKLPSLLGHFGFLNSLEHFAISKKRKKLTLIK